MHYCLKTRDDLIDVLFGEAGGAERLRLLEELEGCAACFDEMTSLTDTLDTFDLAFEAGLPEENFWIGYEERLKVRMAQVIPLNGFGKNVVPHTSPARPDYRLTLLEEVGLTRRLFRQLRDVARDSQLTWPSFREEPFAFTRRFVAAYAEFAWNFVSQRNVALATSSSFVVVFTLVAVVLGLERLRLSYTEGGGEADGGYEVIGMLPRNTSVPEEREKPEEGSPGRAKGAGGGMLSERKRPHGGGGGGENALTPASTGKTPPGQFLPQVVPPSPHPPDVKNPRLPVAPHLDADPVLFPPDYRPLPFGDSKSTSTETSAGPGAGGGIGTGRDGGIGSGQGGGFGPGFDGNTGGGRRGPGGGGPGGPEGGGGSRGNHSGVFTVREVTRKAVLVSKPEPGFTEEARRNNVTGTVKLKLALRADGRVTDVTVVKGLPDGLTERAIQAAKRIQFVPAQKDGRNVSQWVTIEYNFNIY